MATRDELKSLIDRLPEQSLESVRTMLNFHVNPPPPRPPHIEQEMQRVRQRGQEYRKEVERRFRETQKPGTISGLIGGGSWAEHQGTPYGRNSFSYWDDKALVHQTLQSFDGQDIEIMERFALTPDRMKLLCTFEIASAGHITRHDDEFPVRQT